MARGSPVGETDAVTRLQGKENLDIELSAQKPGSLVLAVQLGTRDRG